MKEGLLGIRFSLVSLVVLFEIVRIIFVNAREEVGSYYG